MRSLYISHTGMLEPLGQSQVLPYLVGLAGRGVDIELMSFELPGGEPTRKRELLEYLAAKGITWSPQERSLGHSLAVKVREAADAVLRGLAKALRRRPRIIHGRSYLPSAVADFIVRLSPQSRLIFDCRGMLGDEYVAAGNWTHDRIEYKLLKRYERRLFRKADGLVVLTHALERWLRDKRWIGPSSQATVIPCCVDTERFRPNEHARAKVRRELGIETRTVIVYSGSLGTWYQEKEMARFVALMKKRRSDVVWLVLTHSPSERLLEYARLEGLSRDDVIVRQIVPAEISNVLCAGDLGLSFITSSFSKLGSSPTKVAEYLACGLPTVLNGDIGDQGELASENSACAFLKSYDDKELEHAVERALDLVALPYAQRSESTSRVARERFSLQTIGVERYAALYRALS